MKVIDFYKSINEELIALKNKVRNIIENANWITDGEWKESVLRNILRRHISSNINVGRGFIITKDACSTQIDILLTDTSYPVLFRDGDLVFVTPDAVRGIIEVKTKANSQNIKEAFKKLSDNAQLVSHNRCFIGFFAYENGLGYGKILNKIREEANGNKYRIIDHVCKVVVIFINFGSLTRKTNWK